TRCFLITSRCFFQAEDRIRDFHVTGVQTCALPIFGGTSVFEDVAVEQRRRLSITDAQVEELARHAVTIEKHYGRPMDIEWALDRSEERRVGKERRGRRTADHSENTA